MLFDIGDVGTSNFDRQTFSTAAVFLIDRNHFTDNDILFRCSIKDSSCTSCANNFIRLTSDILSSCSCGCSMPAFNCALPFYIFIRRCRSRNPSLTFWGRTVIFLVSVSVSVSVFISTVPSTEQYFSENRDTPKT